MWMPLLCNLVLLALTTISGVQGNDEINTLVEVFDTQKVGSTDYYNNQVKPLFEQVSMPDSMALVKLGSTEEGREQLESLVTQSMLATLPLDYQGIGGLSRLLDTERLYFRDTLLIVKARLAKVGGDIKRKLAEFKKSGSKRDEDKERVRNEIKESMESQGKLVILASWQIDLACLIHVISPGGGTPGLEWRGCSSEIFNQRAFSPREVAE